MAGGDPFESRPEPSLGVDAVQFRRLDHLADLNHYWDRVRERADLEDVRIHDLRYTFASRAVALGENISMIRQLLGHGQVRSTTRYTHHARDAVKARRGSFFDNAMMASFMKTLRSKASTPRHSRARKTSHATCRATSTATTRGAYTPLSQT